MVQLRTSRRRTIISSSDNEEGDTTTALPSSTKSSAENSKRKNDQKTLISKARNSKIPSQDVSPRPSPQKASGNTKASGPATSKQSAKPIYSFFNSATQKLQDSQSSVAHESPDAVPEGIEIIHDDSDNLLSSPERSIAHLSKDSSTALALRKRKFKRTESFENDGTSLAPTSQKFRKSSSGERASSFSVFNADKRPWTEQFPPLDFTELAVHKRKVSDVRQWLESSLAGRKRRVLVLKGPAGTGKTITVRLLASALGIDLLEWKDTSPSDHGSNDFSSLSSRFEDFVGRAGKSHGLLLTSAPHTVPLQHTSSHNDFTDSENHGRQALLIEEFPNTFSRTSAPLKAFRSVIAQYLATPVPTNNTPVPIIMIISETLLTTTTAAADSFTVHRLLGPELTMHPYLNIVEFNPIAPTFLVKALETVVVKEARKSGRRKTPGPQVLKHLAETGDIRSAISTLEFLCLRGDEGDTWSSKVTFTKPKQAKSLPPLTKSEEEALKLIDNRESTLGIFHSVGKVVYNKRTTVPNPENIVHPPSWLPQHRRTAAPDTDVDALIDDLGTDTSTFVAALHENYALSCASSRSDETLDNLQGCIENISDADLLSLDRFSYGARPATMTSTDGLRQDEMCFQVATRGVLFSLPSPVHRVSPNEGKRGDAHKMFYPASLKLWRKKEETAEKLTVLISRLILDSAMSVGPTKAETGRTGVESWRNTVAAEDASSNGQLSNSRGMTESKAEMILHRLPYSGHILSGPSLAPSASDLHRRITEITRFSEAVGAAENADSSDEEDTQRTHEADQWSTDLPEAKMEAGGTHSQRPRGPKVQLAFEGGGLAIPVESSVEKLVLEDDDIIDD